MRAKLMVVKGVRVWELEDELVYVHYCRLRRAGRTEGTVRLGEKCNE